MDDIKIRRGGHDVVYKKVPEYFAVSLKQGSARSPADLEAALGQPVTNSRHVASIAPERMDIFRIDDPARIEETTDRLRDAPGSKIVSHVYAIDETPGGAVVPTGMLTLRFQPGVAKAAREKLLTDYALEIIEDLDYLPEGVSVRLTPASPGNPLKVARELQARPEIAAAEPDISYRVTLAYRPADPLYAHQWHLNNLGDRLGLAAGADVRAEAAWEKTRGHRDITICVIDDGFDLAHPDFNAPGKIVAPRDFGQNDLDPSPAFIEDNHGTCCAGVALAEENGAGVVGLAPNCSFMPIRMTQWLSDGAIVDYFRYAMENGADVISCSWHAAARYFPLPAKISAIIGHAASQGRTNGRGCVILFAAGNGGAPLNDVQDGIRYHQGFALHPDVIAVGATTSLDLHAEYSNFGNELSICAPSSGRGGRGIVTTDRRGLRGYTSEDYSFEFGGTSSATPLAAGLAALILSVNPELGSGEVKRIMMDTADKIDAAGGGYVDGHSKLYGHGRINAARAVLEAGSSRDADAAGPETLIVTHAISRGFDERGEASDEILFPLEVSAQDLEIDLDIVHPHAQDLRLVVTPPSGEPVELNAGAEAVSGVLNHTLRWSDRPELMEPFLRRSPKGPWRLTVYDAQALHAGRIRRWGIAVTYKL
jgi:subtilisin family serine protease